MSRKLDAAIAEGLGDKVEYGVLSWPDSEDYDYWMENAKKRLPHYSSDGNAMLELIGEMDSRGFRAAMDLLPSGCTRKYKVGLYGDKGFWADAYADSLPLAVAFAAYKALTGKEWSE